ncbi:unnamed protein product [Effrenium voratum]|nr:unnamed protein product [Effrenium voratum]
MTNRSRADAAAAARQFAGQSGAEGVAPLLPSAELRQRLEKGEEIVLVDVRCAEEQQVSMMPGAVTKEHFESQVLPKLRQEPKGRLVVPYCTAGFRSGIYAKELVKYGLNVRNGEGVVMWTFDGNGLVRPSETSLVKEVHVFGKPWDMAAEGYSTVYFSHVGGALRFLKQKCDCLDSCLSGCFTSRA